jgi:energy-coupling factor transporter ATP-binding protein EcfA2
MSDKLISQIRITKLFGLYSYALPDNTNFTNASILYGDNGVGKSTILRLAFHLLSAANDRGHRTALYKAKFESLEIELTSGHCIKAKFINQGKNEKTRTLSLSITEGAETIVIWDYIPKRMQEGLYLGDSELYFEYNSDRLPKIRSQQKLRAPEEPSKLRGEHAYIETLKEVCPTIYILNAERRLDSDEVADPSDEVELRRVMHYEEARKINDLVARSREIALTQALSAASKWIAKKAVQSANRGSENVHTVYSNVLKHLVGSPGAKKDENAEPDISVLIRQLTSIETKTAQLSQYELATPLSTVDFKKALNARTQAKRTLTANLLSPYINSVDGRLNAIDPIYKIIDRFILTVNGLLTDKSIYFKLSQGFSFKNKNGETLDAGQLSSGEQQLLLLFCYVLVARDTPSIFMIDEPEISLNIKWQRQLIQSLLDITSDSRIQFIFASHSLELLSQHRNRVIKLQSSI